MKGSGIRVLDQAPQVAAEWLNALCDDLGWDDRQRAYRLLRETLHALRDHLPADQAADLATQLPILLRGLYFEGWDPSVTPLHPCDKGSFLERVATRINHTRPEDTERAVAAVFCLLRRRLSAGGIDQVAGSVRKPSGKLWQ